MKSSRFSSLSEIKHLYIVFLFLIDCISNKERFPKYTNVYFFMILKYKYDFYGYNFKLCCIISRRVRFYPNNLLWSSKRCKTYL